MGVARLQLIGKDVASANIKTQPGMFGLEGVVTVGRDVGRPASDDYVSPDAFRGGVVEKVTVAVKGSATAIRREKRRWRSGATETRLFSRSSCP